MSDTPTMLVKSEPDCFSIEDLAASRGKTTGWEGVRNFQARNFMRPMQSASGAVYTRARSRRPSSARRCRQRSLIPIRPLGSDRTCTTIRRSPRIRSVNSRSALEETFVSARARTLRGVAGRSPKWKLLRKGSRSPSSRWTEKEFETIMKLAHAAPPKRAEGCEESEEGDEGKKPVRKTGAGVKDRSNVRLLRRVADVYKRPKIRTGSPRTIADADAGARMGFGATAISWCSRRKRHNLPDRCVLCNEVATRA